MEIGHGAWVRSKEGFFLSLLLRLKRDDGAAVYLNGTEVHRVNLPGGVITPETLATREVRGLEEEVFFPTPVSPALLRQGRNVIAVEIHQNSPRSEDLSFDLELSANPVETKLRPDVAFASPRNGALFQSGQTIPIEIEAIDSDGQITSVSLFADGVQVGADTQFPYNFQLTGATLGAHRLRAVATDNDLQQATVDLTITVLDNTPLIVALTEPVDEAVFRVNEAIRLSAQASDPGGAVKRVEFHLRSAELFVAPDRLIGTVESSPYTVVLTGLSPGQYALTAIALDDRGAISQSFPVHFEVQGQDFTSPFKCDTIRFSSPQYWLLNLNRLPRGTVLIGGVNFNSPVSTGNVEAIRLALQGNALGFGTLTPLQLFNREFVAAQLSLIQAGGPAVASNVLWANLGCPGLFGDFAPVTLSNGVVLTPNSMLKDLFMQAQSAIQQNRVVDFIMLSAFFGSLNCDDPFGIPFQSVNCPLPIGTIPRPDLTIFQAVCFRLSPTTVRLTITVQNIGKAPAPPPVTVIIQNAIGMTLAAAGTVSVLAPMGGAEVLTFVIPGCVSSATCPSQVEVQFIGGEELTKLNNFKSVSCP